MKTPLTILSKVVQTIATTPLTETVTLEFCYDHVNEDYAVRNTGEFLLLQHDEFQPLRIQDTE